MILGLIAGFTASLLGWQINLIALQRGLKSGRRRETFFVGAGALAADLVFIYLAFASILWLLRIPHFWMFAKGFGAATLVMVALRVFRHDFRHDKKAPLPSKHKHLARSFLLGFVVVIGNPAVFLLWIGVVGFILTHFPDPYPHAFKWLFLIFFSAGGMLWFIILSSALLPRMRRLSGESLGWISKATAMVLLAAAVILVFEKF